MASKAATLRAFPLRQTRPHPNSCPSTPCSLSPDTEGNDLDQLTLLYKALADQLRLQILRLLRNESFGVLELCRILEIKQSALSHHLKILATADVVTTRREGNSIFYRRNFLRDEDHCRDIKATLFEQIDQCELPPEQEKKIKQIQLERSQLSLNFFNRNAEKFREKQGLIVEHADYHAALLSVIEGLGLEQHASVMEVGPGEGQLLTRLAGKFSDLTALDNSRDMLERSRQAISDSGAEGVRFILGDTAVASKGAGAQRSDCLRYGAASYFLASQNLPGLRRTAVGEGLSASGRTQPPRSGLGARHLRRSVAGL